MSKAAEAYATTVPLDRKPENRMRARTDAAGCVVSLELLTPAEDSDFMGFIERQRTPLEPDAICWPLGWHADADGRGVPV